MKKTAIAILLILPLACLAAEAAELADAKDTKKSELAEAVASAKNHFKFYGFIRNFFAFDTRESVAGTGDLFYYLPKDVNMNEDGSQDLNAQTSFRFLALTSRLGIDVYGYQLGRTSFGAKVETDFYAGLTGINGTAQLRLRQAYMTVGWKDLPMGRGEARAAVDLKLGQAWHPMAADQPHVLSLETGAPFNPFSRTPQVLMDASLGKHFVISAAALWQMQYRSMGPNGSSAEYLKYGCIPEFYAGLTYKTSKGFLARLGVDVLSIKPRRLGETVKDVTVKVSDRITTFSPYIYLQYKGKNFEVKAKTVMSQGGEHMNLMSGYGISSVGFSNSAVASQYVTPYADAHMEYVPLHTSSTWASISYGKKWQVMLMGGYIKNLGTRNPLYGNLDSFVASRVENGTSYTSVSNIYFSSNSSANLNTMWRVVPTVAYNIGKFTWALEWNITSACYGEYVKLADSSETMRNADSSETLGNYVYSATGLASDDLHWVTNHRIQMMVRFSF